MAIIKGEDVLDSYQTVVPSAGTYSDAYIRGIAESVRQQQLPLAVSTQQAATGMLRAAMGQTREFLVLTPTAKNLSDFRILHYGVPSGTNLAVGWYLTGPVRGLGSKQFRVPVLNDRDLFDTADLVALLTGVHQFAVLEQLYAIADQVHYAQNRLGSKSTGLFGIG